MNHQKSVTPSTVERPRTRRVVGQIGLSLVACAALVSGTAAAAESPAPQSATITAKSEIKSTGFTPTTTGLTPTTTDVASKAIPSGSVGIFSDSLQPKTAAVSTTRSTTLGLVFKTTESGSVTGLQFYRSKDQKKAYTGALWDLSAKKKLATVTFPASSQAGWQTVELPEPVRLNKGRWYVSSYLASDGRWAQTDSALAQQVDANGLVGKQNGGRFTEGTSIALPSKSGAGASYMIDVVFTPRDASTPKPTPTPTPTAKPTPTPTPTAKPTPTPTPTPTVKPTPTPTPTPPPTTPPTTPPSTTVPGPGNTGVPAGTRLTRSGSIVVTVPGTVIDGRDVAGSIDVQANNVTIRNSRVSTGAARYPIRVHPGVTGTLIDHVEVSNEGGPGKGIYFNSGSGTVRYSNIHSAEDGVFITADNVTLEYNYIHTLMRNEGAHPDAIQIRGGDNITIRGNNLQAIHPQTGVSNAAIQIGSLVGDTITNLRVTDNLMNGGRFTINGGGRGEVDSAIYSGNRFGRDHQYGVQGNLQNSTWAASNVYYDNGQHAR